MFTVLSSEKVTSWARWKESKLWTFLTITVLLVDTPTVKFCVFKRLLHMFNSCGSSAGSSLHLYSKLYHIDLSCFESMDYFGFFFIYKGEWENGNKAEIF